MRAAFFLWVGMASLFSSYVNAGMSLNATRLIYGERDSDASISVMNVGGQDVIIQAWLENNDNSMTPPPFAVTPPLARLKSNERQLLRVLFQGQGLSKEKESVFWLNVQEIPQVVEGGNTLQLALLQRVKLFYRPVGLIGSANSAPKSLKIRLVNDQLEFYNPTPYHINIITFKQGGNEVDVPMILPYERISIAVKNIKSFGSFSIATVNDYGGVVIYKASLNNGLSTQLMASDK